ncbi:MAG: DUF6788 family protein [Candidatus Deferrimicrobium sp.]
MTGKRTRGPQDYETIKRLVTDVGFIRRGSVVRRFMPCGKPGCRCQATPPRLHGPYYQWTRKVRGKTVTVRLSQEEAALMQEWIANGRRLNKLVSRMETLSLQVTERMLRQVRIS